MFRQTLAQLHVEEAFKVYGSVLRLAEEVLCARNYTKFQCYLSSNLHIVCVLFIYVLPYLLY